MFVDGGKKIVVLPFWGGVVYLDRVEDDLAGLDVLKTSFVLQCIKPAYDTRVNLLVGQHLEDDLKVIYGKIVRFDAELLHHGAKGLLMAVLADDGYLFTGKVKIGLNGGAFGEIELPPVGDDIDTVEIVQLCPFLGVGDSGHEVDFFIFQTFQAFVKAVEDIFQLPAFFIGHIFQKIYKEAVCFALSVDE